MSGRTPIWRSILWIERFLPKPAESRLKQGKGGWRRELIALIPLFAVLPIIVRQRDTFAEIWPRWHGLIEHFVLFLAIVSGLAALVAGVVTWRKNHA